MDISMWNTFLHHQNIFVDHSLIVNVHQIRFCTDSMANPDLQLGGLCENQQMAQRWDLQFIKDKKLKY